MKHGVKIIGIFPHVVFMMQHVRSVLVDINKGWLEMNPIGAASREGVCRCESNPEPISET